MIFSPWLRHRAQLGGVRGEMELPLLLEAPPHTSFFESIMSESDMVSLFQFSSETMPVIALFLSLSLEHTLSLCLSVKLPRLLNNLLWA